MALRGYDPTPDRALLEPRSTSAQLDAVEALARQVERVLSRRSPQQPPIRLLWEGEEEFTTELADLSRSRSLSPVQLEPTVQPVFETKHPSPSGEAKRKKTALKQAKSLDAYQKYPTATSSLRRGSVGAEKYRLSFVDLSDSSNEEEDGGCLRLVKTDCSGGHHSESITTSGVAGEKELNLGKTEVNCDEVVCNEETSESGYTELESVQNLSIGQFSDLHYDDEEIAQSTHNRNHNTQPDINPHKNVMTPKQTGVLSHHHTHNNKTHQHCKTLETNGLMYEDENFDLLIPPSKITPTKTNSRAPHNSSLINSPRKKCTGTDSRPVVTARENTTTGTATQMRHQSVLCMDHASFSPLYAMSITQLQYTVQLLETKLQGNHTSTFRCH